MNDFRREITELRNAKRTNYPGKTGIKLTIVVTKISISDRLLYSFLVLALFCIALE